MAMHHVYAAVSGMVTCDETGAIVASNATFLLLLAGRQERDVLGKSIDTLIDGFFERAPWRSVASANNNNNNNNSLAVVSSVLREETLVPTTVNRPIPSSPLARDRSSFDARSSGDGRSSVDTRSSVAAQSPAVTMTGLAATEPSRWLQPEGWYSGDAIHVDGTRVPMTYQVKHVRVADNRTLYSIWVSTRPSSELVAATATAAGLSGTHAGGKKLHAGGKKLTNVLQRVVLHPRAGTIETTPTPKPQQRLVIRSATYAEGDSATHTGDSLWMGSDLQSSDMGSLISDLNLMGLGDGADGQSEPLSATPAVPEEDPGSAADEKDAQAMADAHAPAEGAATVSAASPASPSALPLSDSFSLELAGAGPYSQFYRTLSSLGSGTFGCVWQAAHRKSGTPVAVKFLPKGECLGNVGGVSDRCENS